MADRNADDAAEDALERHLYWADEAGRRPGFGTKDVRESMLEVAARMNLLALENLEAQIPARLPAALRDDPGADWRQWPGRVKPTL